MSVELPISPPLDQAHRSAIEDANRWRGHCIDCFARIEHEAGETLAWMFVTAPDAIAGVPHNFGEKLREVRAAMAPGTQFAAPKTLKTFDALQEKLDRRNLLVHGRASVWIGIRGDWLLVLRFHTAQTKAEHCESFDRAAAELFETNLASLTQSLCDQLRNIRKGKAVTN